MLWLLLIIVLKLMTLIVIYVPILCKYVLHLLTVLLTLILLPLMLSGVHTTVFVAFILNLDKDLHICFLFIQKGFKSAFVKYSLSNISVYIQQREVFWILFFSQVKFNIWKVYWKVLQILKIRQYGVLLAISDRNNNFSVHPFSVLVCQPCVSK